jgi:hypothetical protein
VNIQGKDLPNGQTEDLKRETREDQKTRAETISETVDSVKKIRRRITAANESVNTVVLCVFSVQVLFRNTEVRCTEETQSYAEETKNLSRAF